MIRVEYVTLQGLEDRLNAIDDEKGQFTAILSLVVLPATAENAPSAVVITKTEIIPELPEGDTDAPNPEFFVAPEAAEEDDSA